jgi:hypothetical protein
MREQEVPENLRWKLLYIADKILRNNLKPMELSSSEK